MNASLSPETAPAQALLRRIFDAAIASGPTVAKPMTCEDALVVIRRTALRCRQK
ncbi:hypothetical protein SAMN05216344_12358 [Polaromonas sp. OV174]|uniref:glycerate-2-kinase family protein n=1 Tax=Polaromonas sp. OV174 TaxID=1855300 RepID=UPI0008F217B0|nr:glycerate-2-kinase family protein [Polaromonas sp. OV174]SFC58777.1 hypothetical protein SAMN05216344_12358 [Polaromonas sp. OV174]